MPLAVVVLIVLKEVRVRMHSSYKKYSSSANPSGAATPTLVQTSGFVLEEPGSCPSTIPTQVMKRQDWICPITGVREEKHWDALAEDPDVLLSVMETCHIFKQAAAHLDLDNPKDCFGKSARDVVRNYFAPDDEEMEALVATVDDPSNGIGFELSVITSLANSSSRCMLPTSRMRILLKRTSIFVSWCRTPGVTNIVLYSKATATLIPPFPSKSDLPSLACCCCRYSPCQWGRCY
ncbi:hypothetical protein EV421DRAFT_2037823, partial [Armillaria borealis]